jgi:hypothetical protein
MPLVYLNLNIDKKLIDHMIKNCDTNLFALAIYKYDDLTDSKENIECFCKKFTYFLPNDVNQNDSIDYNEKTNEENMENTYKAVSIGLLCIDHVNLNKKSIEINAKNTSMNDMVKYIMKDFYPLVLETFSNNKNFSQLILPVKDSVRKALKALNDYWVFYDTPYRYYQDFNCTYVISSSGKSIDNKIDKYGSVVVQIKDILDSEANDIGFIDNKSSKAYEIPVSYADTQVFDNTIANKSKSSIKAVTSSGTTTSKLNNTASYSKEKTVSTRLNNDNDNMIKNIEADSNNSNFFLYFSKNDLDTNIFTINKKISVNHIDAYKEFNGTYLLSRKREVYSREDESFIMTSMINLHMIG